MHQLVHQNIFNTGILNSCFIIMLFLHCILLSIESCHVLWDLNKAWNEISTKFQVLYSCHFSSSSSFFLQSFAPKVPIFTRPISMGWKWHTPSAASCPADLAEHQCRPVPHFCHLPICIYSSDVTTTSRSNCSREFPQKLSSWMPTETQLYNLDMLIQRAYLQCWFWFSSSQMLFTTTLKKIMI